MSDDELFIEEPTGRDLEESEDQLDEQYAQEDPIGFWESKQRDLVQLTTT